MRCISQEQVCLLACMMLCAVTDSAELMCGVKGVLGQENACKTMKWHGEAFEMQEPTAIPCKP